MTGRQVTQTGHSLGGIQLMGVETPGGSSYTQQSHCFPLQGANMTQGHQIVPVNGLDNQSRATMIKVLVIRVALEARNLHL